jgi:hypothetical protein
MNENGKMRPTETILRGEGIGDKGEWIWLRYIVSTFVNVTVYPQYNNNRMQFFLNNF